MKKNIIAFLAIFFVMSLGFSQQQELAYDQNPNYKKSMDKYLKISDKYTVNQGATAQQTYKAIDPLERKRELRTLKRKYRAKRLLWRHQERMEQAKQGNYYPYYDNNDWYNDGWRYNNWYNSGWYGTQNLLNLGLLGGGILR